MGSREFDGKDLDDALLAASEALGRRPSDLDYELIEGGRKGVFGLGARPVRIRIVESPAPASATRPPSPVETAPPAAASGSAPGAMLRRILEEMGLEIAVDESRRDRVLELVVDGPDRGRLTAGRGEVLAALEFLLGRMGRRAWPDEQDVRLVCQGFSSGRDRELVEMARRAASQVARSGKPKRFHAMNPYERRVVHVTVREFDGLTTVSEGDGFLKRVRVEKIAP
ncbi:MAG TPA: R3H domain-containing nucleic acid-binding protein [Candidatus Polarisedimenticolaceae bacterium]|nr:R3H domain-containing nucleic acid-binding protein [Candidatus Polarisedimenticolaceae bacterium]